MAKTNSHGRLLCGLALAGALGAAGGTQASDAALERCTAAQAKALDFSGVVLLSRGADITTYVSGLRAGPRSPAITAETRFNLASAGKLFTATAVAQLVDRGKLGLDDPIGRYVKGLTSELSAVTVSQLLTHRSGLDDFLNASAPPEAVEAARRLTDLVKYVAKDRPASPPGTKYQYSNKGFLLLGMVVEGASGLSYDEYLRRNLFSPAGMRSTTVRPIPGANYATGMTRLSPNQGPPPPGSQPWGAPNAPLNLSDPTQAAGTSAGGYYSTVGDMRRFFLALTNGTLVRPETLREMMKPWWVVRSAEDGKPEVDQGLGMGISSVAGHRSIGHAGGLPGANTAVNFFPDDSVAAIVLANRDPPIAQTLYAKLAPVLFDPEELKRCIDGAHP